MFNSIVDMTSFWCGLIGRRFYVILKENVFNWSLSLLLIWTSLFKKRMVESGRAILDLCLITRVLNCEQTRFPHVIGRMGKLEVADQRLFFIAALDFHHQLTLDDGHLRTFQATFQSVAQTEPIYAELLSLCSLSSPSSSTSAAATAEATSSQ